MQKLIILLIANIFITTVVIAQQKEKNNWFFGNNSGLSFQTGNAVYTPGSVNSLYGSSAISDKNGKLLFYTDGMTVWDSKHAVMPTGVGLNGNNANTQSSIIVPHPGNDSLFYVFTINADDVSKGLQYSVVNMKLNTGLGDVSQVNVPLYGRTCEKIAAIRHDNGRDVWLITHFNGTDEFYVYLIDATGLQTTPLVQSVGSTIRFRGDSQGYLKISPDGKRIAMAELTSFVELFDFNATTGAVSNAMQVHGAPTLAACGQYGVEFSCNSKLLYTSQLLECDPTKSYVIFQYDLGKTTESELLNSRLVVDSGLVGAPGALQLGPDNKIYISYYEMPYMGAITMPNNVGAACKLVKQYINFPGTTLGGFGLPMFLQDQIKSGCCNDILGKDTTLCAGIKKTLRVNAFNAKVKWQDGSTADTFLVTGPGKYWVDIDLNNCISTDTINISYNPLPAFSLGKDTVVCGTNIQISVGKNMPGASYLWQDGSTNPTFSISAVGTYWLQATVNNCAARDSIIVTSTPLPSFSLGNDTAVCSGQSVVLSVKEQFASYLWSNGSNARSITVTNTGDYWCDVTNAAGCIKRDSIRVNFSAPIIISLGKDTTVCDNETLTLAAQAIPGATYLWQDGSTNSSYSVSKAGTYWTQATVNNCSARDSIIVSYNAKPVFSLGNDTTLCDGKPLVVAVKEQFATYVWNNGSTAKSISVTNSGVYWCEVTNSSGCKKRDSIGITFAAPVTLSLGKDTVLCDNKTITLASPAIPGATYLWQDGSTNSSLAVSRSGSYWIQATVNNCSVRDTVAVSYNSKPVFSLGADTTACDNSQLVVLTVKEQFATYLWNNGTTSKSLTASNPGEYWCEVTNNAGCSSRDSIRVAYGSPIIFSLGRDTVLCVNATIMLNATGAGNNFLWQDGSSQSTFPVNKSGTYSVMVSKNGCSKSDTISIAYKATPLPDLGNDRDICQGQELVLSGKVSGASYLWQDGSTNTTFKVTDGGRYSVRVQNECGIGTDEIIVTKGECKIMVPNAFTPGKSGNNLFRITNGYTLKDFRLQVYNRWGGTVFISESPITGWDGNFKGATQPAGVYVWMLSYTDSISGVRIKQKGTLLLIR